MWRVMLQEFESQKMKEGEEGRDKVKENDESHTFPRKNGFFRQRKSRRNGQYRRRRRGPTIAKNLRLCNYSTCAARTGKSSS